MDQRQPETAIAVEVKRIVGHYDFSDAVEVRLLAQSENIVFLVDDPARTQKYVARVNSGRLAYHSKPSIESEMEWLMAIRRDTDIRVPDVLADRNGDTVHTLNLGEKNNTRFAALYSFLEGIEPPEDNLVRDFFGLGAITAKLHEHSKCWTPPDSFKRHSWSAEDILDDTLNWGHWKDGIGIEGETAQVLARAETVVRKRMEDLPSDKDNFGLIHADLRLPNLLVNGAQMSIIDFDDCGYGWFLYELAAAVSFIEDHADFDQLLSRWIEGYQTVSEIDQEILDALPTLLLLRRFSLIAWLGYQQDHLEFAREIGPSFTRDAHAQAIDYLERWG